MIFKEFKITSKFGPRSLKGDNRFHSGLDIVGLGDITILSPVDGKIAQSRIITNKRYLTWEWGNYVCVFRETDNTQHYFAHMKERLVNKGNTVNPNDKLGIMGATGYSYGAHVHYGIRKNGKWIDPLKYYGLEYLEKNKIYKLEDIMINYKDSINKLEKRVEELENDNKIYKHLKDLPEYYKGELTKLIESGYIKGKPDGTIDLSMNDIRTILICKRMMSETNFK